MNNTVLDALWKLSKGRSHIKPTNLIGRLSKATGLSITDIKAALGQLSKEGVIIGVSLKGDLLGNIRILVSPPQPILSETEEMWQSALLQSGYEAKNITTLLKCAEYLDGASRDDMARLLTGIAQIKSNIENLSAEDPYIVSARYLLGSAKALKVIGESFGVPFSKFRGRVAYAVVAGPTNPEAVLFIENVASFEKFCSTPSSEKIMAVATFGYSLAWNNLADEIRSESLTHLVRKHSPPRIREVIDSRPLFFWGDLDQEGLNIFVQLNRTIPTLQLSALYLPMINALSNNQSHSYGKLSGKEKQRKVKSDNEMIKKLSALCEKKAVDQEIVDDAQIAALCSKPLLLK